MTREINGVAYSPDYEDLVGPIPEGKQAAKVISSAEVKVVEAPPAPEKASKTQAETK